MSKILILKQKFRKNRVDASALYRTIDFLREKMSEIAIYNHEIWE